MATQDIEIRVALRDEVTVPLKKVESGIIRFVGAITASIAAVKTIAFPLREAAEFERAMLDVAKTTGFTGASFDKLGDDLLDLSKKINVAATDLAEIAAVAGQLGLGTQGTEGIAAFTETTARFSAVLDVAVNTAAEGLAKISNIFQISLKDAERIASAFNEVSNTSTASGEALLDVVKRLGNANNTIDLAESIGLAATGVDFGLTLETIGTSFTKIFANMQARAEQFADFMGVSTKEWADTVQSDGIGAWKKYLETLQNVDSATRASVIRELSGGGRIFSLVSKSVADAANNYAILNRNIQNGTDAYVSGTSAINEHAKVLDGLIPRLQILGNSFTAIGTKIGQDALPYLKGLTQTLQGVFTDPEIIDSLQEFGKAVGRALIHVADMVKYIAQLDINWKNLVTILEYFVGLQLAKLLLALGGHLTAQIVHVARLGKSWTALAANIETATVAKLKFLASGGAAGSGGTKNAAATTVQPSTNVAAFLGALSFTAAGRATNTLRKYRESTRKLQNVMVEDRRKFIDKSLALNNKYSRTLQRLLNQQLYIETNAAKKIATARANTNRTVAARMSTIQGIYTQTNNKVADLTQRQNFLAVKAQATQSVFSKFALTLKNIPSLLSRVALGIGRFLIGPFGFLSILVLDFLGVFGKLGDAFSDLFRWLGFSSRESQRKAKEARLETLALAEQEKQIRATASAYRDLIDSGKNLSTKVGRVGGASDVGSLQASLTPKETGDLTAEAVQEIKNVSAAYKDFGYQNRQARIEVDSLNRQILEQQALAKPLVAEIKDLSRQYSTYNQLSGTTNEAKAAEIYTQIERATTEYNKIISRITELSARRNVAFDLAKALRLAEAGGKGLNRELNKTIDKLEESAEVARQIFAQSRSQTTALLAPIQAAMREYQLLIAANEEEINKLNTSIAAAQSEIANDETAVADDEKVKKLDEQRTALAALVTETSNYTNYLGQLRTTYTDIYSGLDPLTRRDALLVESVFGSAKNVEEVRIGLKGLTGETENLGRETKLSREQMLQLGQAMFASNKHAQKAVEGFKRIKEASQEAADEATTRFKGVNKELAALQDPIAEISASSTQLFGNRAATLQHERDIKRINKNYDWAVDRITKIKERTIDRLRTENAYYGSIQAAEKDLTRAIAFEERQRQDAITTKEAEKATITLENQIENISNAGTKIRELEKELKNAIESGDDYQSLVLRNRIESQVQLVSTAQDEIVDLINRMSGDEFKVGPEGLERFLFGEKDAQKFLKLLQTVTTEAGSAIHDVRKTDSEEATKRATEVSRVYETMETTVREATEQVKLLQGEFKLSDGVIAAMQERVDTLGESFDTLAQKIAAVPTLEAGLIDVEEVGKTFVAAITEGYKAAARDPEFVDALNLFAAAEAEQVKRARKKANKATPDLVELNTRQYKLGELQQGEGAATSEDVIRVKVDTVKIQPRKYEIDKTTGEAVEVDDAGEVVIRPAKYVIDPDTGVATKAPDVKVPAANVTVAPDNIKVEQPAASKTPEIKGEVLYDVNSDNLEDVDKKAKDKLGLSTAEFNLRFKISEATPGADVGYGIKKEIEEAEPAEVEVETFAKWVDPNTGATTYGPVATAPVGVEVEATTIEMGTGVSATAAVDVDDQQMYDELQGTADRIGPIEVQTKFVSSPTVSPPAQRNAAGGHIRGPGTGTSDSILSWLSNGEFVVKARAVQKYGAGLLHQINNLSLPKSYVKNIYNVLREAPAYAAGGLASITMPSFKYDIPAFASGGEVSSTSSTMETIVRNIASGQAQAPDPYTERVELSLDIGGERYTVNGSRDQVKGLVNALKDVSRSVRRS